MGWGAAPKCDVNAQEFTPLALKLLLGSKAGTFTHYSTCCMNCKKHALASHAPQYLGFVHMFLVFPFAPLFPFQFCDLLFLMLTAWLVLW